VLTAVSRRSQAEQDDRRTAKATAGEGCGDRVSEATVTSSERGSISPRVQLYCDMFIHVNTCFSKASFGSSALKDSIRCVPVERRPTMVLMLVHPTKQFIEETTVCTFMIKITCIDYG